MSRGEPLLRQWNLLRAIQSNRYGLSTDELAKRLECSTRQVLRNIKILKDVGFPIAFETRDYGKRYWKLTPDFIYSDHQLFTLTEFISLFLSLKMLEPLAGTLFAEGIHSLFEKIRAVVSPQTLDYFSTLSEAFLVKRQAYNDLRNHDHTIRLLTDAIHTSTIVSVNYRSQNHRESYVTCYHPYGLVYFDNDLYCIGLMERYSEIRTIKISRIASAELTATAFQRPKNFSLEMYMQDAFGIFSDSGRSAKVQIQMSGWAATSIRETRRHPSQTIVVDRGDCLVVEFKLSDLTELKRWVLGFGRHATVLSPKSFIAEIAAEIEMTAQNYGCKENSGITG
jgi:predicted DNA-binding transcriptional regulator YafY